MSDATDNRFYREPATPGAAGDLRERLVDAVLDVLAEEPIATQQEGGERLADVMLAMVQPELERLTKLAEANGGQARFWADHFAEVEKANRDALGAYHKPGHTVAELITAVVGELAEVRASREAWVLEADRLDVIATESCLVTHPWECGRDESDCTNDDSCPRAEERYATADDLMGVMALSEEVARLTRERDDSRADAAANEATLDTVTRRLAEALNLDEVSLDEMLFMVGNIVDERHGSVIRSAVAALESAPEQVLASRPAIPADALAKPDGVLYALLRVWLDSPLNRDSSERAADAAASAVRHWSAPVSSSDTTEDGEGRG